MATLVTQWCLLAYKPHEYYSYIHHVIYMYISTINHRIQPQKWGNFLRYRLRGPHPVQGQWTAAGRNQCSWSTPKGGGLQLGLSCNKFLGNSGSLRTGKRGKWTIEIDDVPIKHGNFHSFLYVYQRDMEGEHHRKIPTMEPLEQSEGANQLPIGILQGNLNSGWELFIRSYGWLTGA